MIKTTNMLLEELNNYKAPANKLTRMVADGSIFPLRRGLYETNRETPGYLLAGSIYGPSYLSFEFALSRYGLIPEAVYTFTSATFDKKKKKSYQTHFGTFSYRDVPADVYSLGILYVREGDYIYQIAAPEKALCDKLYTCQPANNQKELISLLFENLRIDEDGFENLEHKSLLSLAERYKSSNLKLLSKILI
jgi:predicted transcriptional regulator of viral defense system